MKTPQQKHITYADSKETLLDFLKVTKEKSEFVLKEIEFKSQNQWDFSDGALSHTSKGFFQVIGVENLADRSDQKLMLYQPQSALTGLIITRQHNELYVLLQARVEPGNTGVIQFGPTIQSTPANYLRLHGGKATAYIEYFTSFVPGCNLITHSMQHDLGSKYFQKSKTHHYLFTEDFIETQENMIWASLRAIKGVLEENNFLNADLRSLLAVFDWDGFLMEHRMNSNEMKIDPPKNRSLGTYKMIPLDQLNNWRKSESGITPKKPSLPAIGFFHFSATNREVKAWSQPLYKIQNQGLVQLAYRNTGEKIEFLIKRDHEWGISTEFALYPSYMNSPENPNSDKPITNGRLKKRIIQCDEGGRFFQNDSEYQLIEIDDFDLTPGFAWTNSDTLTFYLKQSNYCSFQLRCAASIALDILQPKAFGD
ncbi:NDP-hexose 2,3-dehydratase family protein [Algoriphagus marincola]|uniref:NDP-hexose 2,3-dehydratase family protein n=1 Tax=Algoriphagus marincola TaxID=264027 RepID=A0ABS7N359_9BACT|nr:NDP-hexose 2,3-dehydratase family protein [Algoriphagus marincola]MBY5950775.1 NDP-hexose 2,3-dehydratase family protein [Algoriphagus marincola]